MKRLSKVANKSRKPFPMTITWDELPGWMKDNEYIRTELRSLSACLFSVLGYFHNETVNIHSHLWGAALFVFLGIGTYPYFLATHASVTWKDVASILIFLCAAVFCLLSSAVFHCVSCHSRQVAKRCNALDYTGIISLIVGSFFPSLHFGFFCEPKLHRLYLAGICSAGFLAAFIVLNPSYSTPKYRWARTVVFLTLGSGGIVPVAHGLFTAGFRRLAEEMGLVWVLVSAFFYISGAIMYASRFPERLSPGTFDLFGASHQIFHVHILLAVLAHYVSILTAVKHRHGLHEGVCFDR
ncbi:hemolysin-III related-domain-containing protein [Cantharellus anzutake]|uniref:hemolysin-III related-domain-containing protein n=1 Tax=Cantharellus anzutake TaxID=1750568 RepID=UPI001902C727|nr:hemolysin-III related-domain-containing protein [Cantharellus anzutake]KAF8334218.1 hemolysin-III related-domain-containing protein [Cantharellus anzutake]